MFAQLIEQMEKYFSKITKRIKNCSFKWRLKMKTFLSKNSKERAKKFEVAILDCILKIAVNNNTTLGRKFKNFMDFIPTVESPKEVLVLIRDFMTEMKNMIVTYKEFDVIVKKEKKKLKNENSLNLDAILEKLLSNLIIRPLKQHLYRLFLEKYIESGQIQNLADNIRNARTKNLTELGATPKILPPNKKDLKIIQNYLSQLHDVDSPIEKMDILLSCVKHIFNSIKKENSSDSIYLGADDFLPVFIWVLSRSGMLTFEIEAQYMWELLPPYLLNGEEGYYLTTLCSVVQILNEFGANPQDSNKHWMSESFSPIKPVLKMAYPNKNMDFLTNSSSKNFEEKKFPDIIDIDLYLINFPEKRVRSLMERREIFFSPEDGQATQAILNRIYATQLFQLII